MSVKWVRYLSLIILSIWLGGSNCDAPPSSASMASVPASAKTTTLHVDSMTCGGCVIKVTDALKSIDGVYEAKVKKGEAIVRYDASKVTKDQLVAALVDIGHKAHAH